MKYNLPDNKGHFEGYGGRFIPETLVIALEELTAEYSKARRDKSFQKELTYYLREYAGRPTPLYFAERLSDYLKIGKIYLKREDLLHTGAHKINNTLGQILLAKRMGVKKTIAEVENMEYINLAENTGIDTIINKKISAASRIFRHTTNPNVTQVKYMTGTDAEVLEFNVPENSKITKGTLRSIDFPRDAIVGGGTRDGVPFIATGDTIIKANDKVVVFTLPSAYEKLSKYFT